METKHKIAIIGSYPPPYGGISVHVQRMIGRLGKDEFILYNTAPSSHPDAVNFYGKRKLLVLVSFLFKKFRLIHNHSQDRLVRMVLCALGYVKKNIYLHIHNASLEEHLHENGISSFLLKKMLKNVHIIADNSRIQLLAAGYNPRSMHQIDAFIPPVYDAQIYQSFCSSFSPPPAKIIIIMGGWFSKVRDTDLYGFDMAVEALHTLRNKNHHDIAIIASINGILDQSIYDHFIDRRSAYKLEKYFVILTDELEEIWPLYLLSDMFIRPTITDGSSVALREAKWFELKTIASDAVPRPEDVRLFKNRNVDELVAAITREIKNGLLPREQRVRQVINKKF